jgi:hypothetical protein
MKSVTGLPETSWRAWISKFFENFSKTAKIRCILQGFADRGGVAQEIEWFIKNIQPISVGV